MRVLLLHAEQRDPPRRIFAHLENKFIIGIQDGMTVAPDGARDDGFYSRHVFDRLDVFQAEVINRDV